MTLVTPARAPMDPTTAIIVAVTGRGEIPRVIRPGLLVAGLNADRGYAVEQDSWMQDIPGVEHSFGVADTPEQVLQRYPVLAESEDRWAVFCTPFYRISEESPGGWRWHKWGPYIGDFEPQCEYLADEPEIERIYTYRIMRVQFAEEFTDG